uniref:Probable RuBisCO transcriptional regulator n=2 Tax=Pavlovaceae TaxID=418969 RepID=M1JFF0_DIALT|nr:lysR transcriptional regulator [Diacronema lutheri]YP_009863811.1 lysR transcritional regulator [Pavlova sp. NIVA-4/92]AGE93788.1 lysR transcriptional regulator [Diacronema lutheri]QKE31142.1 lysR transcritional regulator [Pavlova sp. NIVA-4/92]
MADIAFTLDQLRILKAIVQEKSFKKAAESLYISQPAVSFQIQNLERSLNTALFYRHTRKAQLTEAGKLLSEYAVKILSLCEESYRSIKDLESLKFGSLTIGASQTIGTYLMPKLIGRFREKYPNVSVRLEVHSTRKAAWKVAKGSLDLAITGGEIPNELKKGLEVQGYAWDELVLILPKKHPFADKIYLSRKDLYELKFLTLEEDSSYRRVLNNILQENSIESNKLDIEMELSSIEAIKNAVESGLGAAFVSISAIRKELELDTLRHLKVNDLTVKRQLSIIINKERYRSKAAEMFMKEILFSTKDENEIND